jgi:hypothetical protein
MKAARVNRLGPPLALAVPPAGHFRSSTIGRHFQCLSACLKGAEGATLRASLK